MKILMGAKGLRCKLKYSRDCSKRQRNVSDCDAVCCVRGGVSRVGEGSTYKLSGGSGGRGGVGLHSARDGWWVEE